jgi:hypothetical protein
MSNPEIEKMLVCSTAHLTEEQCNVSLPACKDMMEIHVGTYNVLVRIPDWVAAEVDYDGDQNEFKNRAGENIFNIMCYALKELGCKYVNFDCDGLELDSDRFTVYDW